MSRTVTKEQLKKSGFGSLRDFMNANKYDADKGKYVKREKALKRKDGQPATKVKKKITGLGGSLSSAIDSKNFAKNKASRGSNAPKTGTGDVKAPSTTRKRNTGVSGSNYKGLGFRGLFGADKEMPKKKYGGKMPKFSSGGAMPMNPATGKPTFVGDGKGKMAKGGKVPGFKHGTRDKKIMAKSSNKRGCGKANMSKINRTRYV